MDLFTPAWWHAAGQRAAYTALAALLPLAALLVTGEVTPLYVASLVGLTVLASLATSLAGLPEVSGKVVPWWQAIAIRVLKTAGQVAAPTLGSVLLLEDVGWYELGVTVGGAALTTLIRALMAYLPEDAATPLPAARNVGGAHVVTRRSDELRGREVAELVIHDPDGAIIGRLTTDGRQHVDRPAHRAEE